MSFIGNIAARTGRSALSNYSSYRDFKKYIQSILMSLRSLKHLKLRSLYSIVFSQIKYTGIDALPLISAVAILLGATVIIQATQKFPKFGIEGFIGDLLVLIIAREIGPLATVIIVISRSGSAIATEIAMQKQNKEIRSLELLGIDTKLYIVFPRIVASVVSIFALIVIFDIIAFTGGYLLSLSTVYIPVGQFVRTLLDSFTYADIFITVVKSLVYGLLVPLICCYYGFKPGTPFQIPIFVSKAVVRTLLFVIIVNVMISALFYL